MAALSRKRMLMFLAVVAALGFVLHMRRVSPEKPLFCHNLTVQIRDGAAGHPGGKALPSSAAAKLSIAALSKHGDTKVYNLTNFAGCRFHLPVTIPRWGSAKMCTYDPNVDTEISAYVKEKRVPYSETDITLMLDTMHADVTERKAAADSISLVDVGCNIGLFTLSAAFNGYRVLAVDAMNSSLQLVATSLRLANLTPRVTMLHNAISDKHRDVVIQVGKPDNIGASRVRPAESNEAMNTGVVNTQTVVKAICLDDLVPYVPTRRIFLKMDIEGSEWLALRCADRFFSELDVPYFHMEWDLYRHTFEQEGDALVCDMTARGYQPFHPKYPNYLLQNVLREDWPGNILWIRTFPAKT